ncbi:MAG TPA: glucoamylase family protein [Bryobacteraceae bacterium]|nr:glucoamylase family protein [Bryobacteraceae bacterium]
MISRRELLLQLAAASSGKLKTTLASDSGATARPGSADLQPVSLAPEDDSFLDQLEKAHFLFFWEQADPKTGLVRDHWEGKPSEKEFVASIAATGFGLTALCIGHKRGFASPSDIRARALNTLLFLWKTMPNHRGFFYHWANMSTGERVWDAEVSSIDTSILLCGILTCREYFNWGPLDRLANAIFTRVDWSWAAEDTSLVSHGWRPEGGFLPYRWDYYSELVMMNLLGMGSPSHPLPEETWSAWKRTNFEYDGLDYIGSFAPLFVHQYPQAWFDLRGKRDQYADYFNNSRKATEAHRLFCLDLAPRFPDYTEDFWGITASNSQHGYAVWGGPPEIGPIDGTVTPSAAGGSLVFLPNETLRVLKTVRNRFGDRGWCRYGLVNALNPLKNWFDPGVIGIDTGITLLMAENLRTGFVWETFMKSPEARRGLERAGFKAV